MSVYYWCGACQVKDKDCSNPSLHKSDGSISPRADFLLGGRTGKRIRRLFRTIKDARDYETLTKADYRRGKLIVKDDKTVTFGEIAEKYWKEYALINCRNPHQTTRYHINDALELIGSDRVISPLSDDQVKDFKNDMRSAQRKLLSDGLSGSTVNRKFNIIHAIFNKAMEWGVISTNPMSHIKRVEEDTTEPRFLDKDEIELLFKTVKELPYENERIQRILDYMSVIALTGARPSSIKDCSFDNGDVDMESKIIWFTTYKGSGRSKKYRYHVPIPDRLMPLIQRRMGETGKKGPVFDTRSIGRLCRQVINRSGLNKNQTHKFTMYGLKHCFVSHILMNGGNELEVAKLLGHTDVRMIHKHYSKFTVDYLRETQRKANYLVDTSLTLTHQNT